MKKLIVFNLDGTLAESMSALDAEMAKVVEVHGNRATKTRVTLSDSTTE